MKTLGFVFVTLASMAMFTGCKKSGGGDCASSINGFVDRVMGAEMKSDKMPPEMKKMAEDMMKSMSTTMIKVCTDDKWSAEALKCMNEAKDEQSADKCEGTLTAEQKKHLDDAMQGVMEGGGIAKRKKDVEPPPPPTEGSAATPPPAPVGSGSGG